MKTSLIGTSITKAKRSQRSQTKQILTAILSGGDGFYRDSWKDRWSVRNWSPYAYGDSPYAYREEGRKFCIWGIPVRITKLCAHWEQHIYLKGLCEVWISQNYILCVVALMLSSSCWWIGSHLQGNFLVLFFLVVFVSPHAPTRSVRGVSISLRFAHMSQ